MFGQEEPSEPNDRAGLTTDSGLSVPSDAIAIHSTLVFERPPPLDILSLAKESSVKRTLHGVAGAIMVCVAICYGQTDPTASKMADTFLTGVKLIDMPEGKKMLTDTVWNDPDGDEYPLLTEASTLFEGMYPTDISGIQGYKRLVEGKGMSKAGTPLVKRYILIAYKDISSGKWKVLHFKEATDLDHEADEACSRAANPEEYLKRTLPNSHPEILKMMISPYPQFAYRDCGYWSEMAGKILQAKAAYLKASDLNRLKPADKGEDTFDRKYTQDY
jgi:hypothetical protein